MSESKMRWVRHVAQAGEMRNANKFLFEDLIWRDHLENCGIDGWIILKVDLKETGCEGVDRIQMAQARGVSSGGVLWTQQWTFGFCEEFLNQPSDNQLLDKDSLLYVVNTQNHS